MKNTFANRLKASMDKAEISPVKLSEITGLSQALISQYLSGKFEAKNDKTLILANALKTSPEHLLGWDNIETISVANHDIIQMPLYSEISCGKGMFTDDNIIEIISFPADMLKRNKDYFAQYAKGDSMIEENINTGDLLVFEKTQHIENGEVGCFCVDENAATCKRFYKDEVSNIIMLQPANNNYQPIVVTVESMNFHVVGKLKLVINKR